MHLDLYIDGGCIGANPSTEGVYFSVGRALEDGGIDLIAHRCTDERYATNNEAEYLALICALEAALAMGTPLSVRIHCDSQLIVNQFNGKWKQKDGRMKELCLRAWGLASLLADRGTSVEVQWVPRQENVDRLGH